MAISSIQTYVHMCIIYKWHIIQSSEICFIVVRINKFPVVFFIFIERRRRNEQQLQGKEFFFVVLLLLVFKMGKREAKRASFFLNNINWLIINFFLLLLLFRSVLLLFVPDWNSVYFFIHSFYSQNRNEYWFSLCTYS